MSTEREPASLLRRGFLLFSNKEADTGEDRSDIDLTKKPEEFMIYKIRNELEWHELVEMMQKHFQRDMKDWDSIRQDGEFSQTTDLCMEMLQFDDDTMAIDGQAMQAGVLVIQDKYDALRDEVGQSGDRLKEIALSEAYDNEVCALVMRTVRPRYPVLVMVDVLHVHGDVRSMINETMLLMSAQRDTTPPESPSKLPCRMWREAGNRTPEEMVEELKKAPGRWTAMQDGVGGIRVEAAISSVCVAVKLKLEFVCCRWHDGMWRVSWREDGKKIGINVALKDKEDSK